LKKEIRENKIICPPKPYSHPARFGDDVSKTNPEEMIGAAHAGCYSMFLSALITKEGLKPASVGGTESGVDYLIS
jgi:organic hydroperoxide reductase OsmC/OhrA